MVRTEGCGGYKAVSPEEYGLRSAADVLLVKEGKCLVISLPRYSYVIAFAPLVVYAFSDYIFYKSGLGNQYIGVLDAKDPSVSIVYNEAGSRFLHLASISALCGSAIISFFMWLSELFSRNNIGNRFYDKKTILQYFIIFIALVILSLLCYNFCLVLTNVFIYRLEKIFSKPFSELAVI